MTTSPPLPRRPSAVAAAVLVAAVVGGCGDAGTEQPRLVARNFERAVGAGQFGGACQLLAPETLDHLGGADRCATSLARAQVPGEPTVLSVGRYGRHARVLLDGDVVFLARYEQGWLVTAAGCEEPQVSGDPYDCSVSGG